jgi:L-seryl-tRNA(Ser) seleniumtransferase
MSDTPTAILKSLPSVDRLLNTDAGRDLVAAHGHAATTTAIRASLDAWRNRIREAKSPPPDPSAILDEAAIALDDAAQPALRPVFNLTGTVLHTNLGRAYLPEEAIDAIADVARSPSNLEYDVDAGRRGDRDSHIEDQICRLTGAEAATIVNNNAAAVMLTLNTLALGKQVPVSRGELVEIGGAFRIPDIMTRSGCTLVEVGTTNRTHLKDFTGAIGPDTAMIMKVHTSNYLIEGFTATVPETELAELCRSHSIPFVNDLGSGTLINLENFGLPHEPTPMDALRAGADVVTFSGDKLLGGPQAGLIVGRKDFIAKIKANPMKRALRCDKMTIAALSAVLRLYANPDTLAERLPALAALTRPQSEIRSLAERIAPTIAARLGEIANVSVIECASEIGSGALPTRTIPSAGIAISPAGQQGRGEGTALKRIAEALRALPKPVIGHIESGAIVLDLRTLTDQTGFCAQLDRLELKA